MVYVKKRNGRGFSRFVKAAYCSYKGLRTAWCTEDAFRQESIITLLLLICSFFVASSIQHWLSLVFSLLLVLVVELINSSIENVCDRITLNDDEFIARAKDMGSAAVILALLYASLTWGVSLFQIIIN